MPLTTRNVYVAFAAGAAAALAVSHLPLAVRSPIGIFNRKRETDTFLHLDSSGWTRKGFQLSEDQLKQGKSLGFSESSRNKVLKINSEIVVKFRHSIDLIEADNMEFIRSHTDIPVPKVLNAYEENENWYIVMECMEGEQLEKVWARLSASEKDSICSESRHYLRQMREIPPPSSNFIGSVIGGPAVDRRSAKAIWGGPFSSEQDFNEWQLAQLREPAVIFQDMCGAMHRTDHRIVFSHGDLAFHNILVRNGHVTAILDWEYAGWFPEHWDFRKSMQFLSGTDELYLFCKKMYGKTYMSEYHMDTWFNRSVRHGGW